MRIRLFFNLFLMAVFLNASYISAVAQPQEAVVEANNAFSFDLYAQLKKRDGNLFLSPFSISTALAMTYAGARGNTASQMAAVLHFSLSQEKLHPAFFDLMQELKAEPQISGFELSVANALWGQAGYEFLPEFLEITQRYYEAGFKEVDFKTDAEAVRQIINKWVEEKTKDKIKELIMPGLLNTLTRLVLTNAIYFKGKWVAQFEKDKTKPEEFELLTGEKIEVPMMSQNAKFRYGENEILQILEMPYVGERLSMVILLPKKKKGIKQLENGLNLNEVQKWLAMLRKQEVIVTIPKFKMTAEFRLNEALRSLGMRDAFDFVLADFSGMTPDPVGLYISAVIHKAFVEVNEEGTEAAAATAVLMVESAAISQRPVVFYADHPFIFLIRDMQSGSILFIGRLMDPR
ncbi:MAG: serpin family protein [Candidatus Omnitrophica bacterium]|nr:serpin family protein [Candidatus Omnitrophota bacterium]MCM8770655.1 serpin family protein [Candidatus Omnitrophota bacterium]